MVRDYVHVVDLADGLIAALNKVFVPSVGMISEYGESFLFHVLMFSVRLC